MRFEYSDGRMPNVMSKGATLYYLTYDQVGSLRAVSDSTGAIVKRIDYDSFGNILVDTNPTFTIPFGFAGGLHDRDIDLVHFGFRDYDPATGRWTAKDPIGFAGGDVDLYGYVDSVGKLITETNLYAYTSNNPINRTDPLGLYWGEDQVNWWNYESALPGPYGQPVSEWQNGSPTGWGDPMKYTEGSCGWEKTGERIAVGTAAGATAIAVAAGTGVIPNWSIGWKGGEITLTRPGAPTPDWRFNPTRMHYHRRPGIGNHRPWEGGW